MLKPRICYAIFPLCQRRAALPLRKPAALIGRNKFQRIFQVRDSVGKGGSLFLRSPENMWRLASFAQPPSSGASRFQCTNSLVYTQNTFSEEKRTCFLVAFTHLLVIAPGFKINVAFGQ
jgi:hypothetical protein